MKSPYLLLSIVSSTLLATGCSFLSDNNQPANTDSTPTEVNTSEPASGNSGTQSSNDIEKIIVTAVTNVDTRLCQGIGEEAKAKECMDKVNQKKESAAQSNLDSNSKILVRAKDNRDVKLCDTLTIEALQPACRRDVVTLKAIDAKDRDVCQELPADDVSDCEGQVDIAVGPGK